MAKIVYIAEKKNVGDVMAEHLWGSRASSFKDRVSGNLYRGQYNGDEVVVTWAHGHILQDALPPDYDPKFADPFLYPVIPSLNTWKLVPEKQTKPLLDTIKKEIKDADIVVNGGDPDREGQLLVDEILVYLGYRGKSQRIMIDGWDEKNVTRAFNSMDDNNSPVHRNMYSAGLARKIADWLVGMNFCRAYSAAARKAGCNEYLNIGRVKSWVLGMVVRREREIANFKSKKYYLLDGHYIHNNVPFHARFQPDDSMTDEEGRICGTNGLRWLKDISEQLKTQQAVVKSVKKNKGKTHPPLPYSLDSLQVDGSKAFGYSPQKVLDYTQELYEKKLVTYPRSDCRYIPPSQHDDAKEILPMLARFGIAEAAKADASITSKAFNEKKITAHHAVIPTTMQPPSDLTETQRNIYILIAKRYILQFYPPCEFDSVSFDIQVGEYLFHGAGKDVMSPGFTAVFKNVSDDDDGKCGDEQKNLPDLQEGMVVGLDKDGYVITSADTKPPAYFREDSIIKAMTDVWRYVDAKETITIDGEEKKLRDVLKECNGIGTPATRGTILEDLKRDYRYVVRKDTKKKEKMPKEPCLNVINKNLRPTIFGMQIVDSLCDSILDTAMTARMEFNLKRIADGKYKIEDYLKTVVDFVNDGIDYAEKNPSKVTATKNGGGSGSGMVVSDVKCPVCGRGKLRLAKFKGNPDLKLPPYEAWICNDKKCLEENGIIAYWGTSKKPVVEKCPVCGRFMKAVRTKAGLKKWICFHGKDTIEGSLWLDVVNGGKAASVEKCPVCGGIMRRVKSSKSDKYSWVCDHGKNGDALWLDDDNGKPAKLFPCPECGRPMRKFISKKTGKPGYMCSHGVKDGKPLFLNMDENGNPVSN